MRADRTNDPGTMGASPGRRLFALCMLLLGLAVFCWGLHDKLSLYAPPNVPPPVAKAKLLSSAEQPSTQLSAALPQPERVVPPLLFLFFAALLILLQGTLRRETLCARPQRSAWSPPFSPQLYRRPPPPAAA